MTNRIQFIDETKGFLLLAVCLGHCMGYSICGWGSFGLTLFFAISGYLFVENKYNDITLYIKRKIRTFLIPYLALTFIFPPMDVIHSIKRLWDSGIAFNDAIKILLPDLLHFYLLKFSSLYQGMSGYGTSPLWFVWTLFLCSVLFFIVYHYSKNNKFIICSYGIILGGIGWYLNLLNVSLPFNLSTFCTASFFYTLGFVCKNIFSKLHNPSKVSLLVIFAISLSLYIIFIPDNGFKGLVHNELDTDIISFICCNFIFATCIISFFVIFEDLNHITLKIIKSILRWSAKNGIVILAAHSWFGLFFSILFPNLPIAINLLLIILMTYCTVLLFNQHFSFILGQKKRL